LPCQGLKDISLPCDELCLKELRQKKLAEAFGISSDSGKPPVYSDLLINSAKALPVFIKNIETQFLKLIRSGEATVKLPPMDNVQRQIVHELAKYYFIETDSVGLDVNRHVTLIRKTVSRPPLFALSQVVHMQQSIPSSSHISEEVVNQPGSSYLNTKPITAGSTLHIYDLSPAIRTPHLQAFLKEFEGQYVLQWIDESNALAIFHQQNSYLKALGAFHDNSGTIKVKAYRDSNPGQGDGEGNLVLGGPAGSKYIPPQQRPGAKTDKPVTTATMSDFKTVVSGSKQKHLDQVEPTLLQNQFSVLSYVTEPNEPNDEWVVNSDKNVPMDVSESPEKEQNVSHFDDWESIPEKKSEEFETPEREVNATDQEVEGTTHVDQK